MAIVLGHTEDLILVLLVDIAICRISSHDDYLCVTYVA
jgi:hypothetical protein